MRSSLSAIFFALFSSGAFAVEPIPDRLVVLTFDDASRSHHEVVAPLLEKHGFGATFFVTEGFDFASNNRDYMTWEQIADLHRRGFEIGNHTRYHKAPSAKNRVETLAQLEAIDARCREFGIPKPTSFAYPGNALDREVLPILSEAGIRFARRGGAPEHPYDQGRGFAYEPGLDHPLLIPSAGDARPDWTLDDFQRAVGQAKHGRIVVVQFHGVPDTARAWVNTSPGRFSQFIEYLAKNGFKAIAVRDLARYVDASVTPKDPWGVIEDRRKSLKRGLSLENGRAPRDQADRDLWLVRMREHDFTVPEIAAAFGLDESRVAAKWLAESESRIGVDSQRGLRITPYPGGRHPRTGFLDGALRPQRETKMSIFAPWKDGGYVVADIPEAVWHQPEGRRKLLYLAHTHVTTVWEEKGIDLPKVEWQPVEGGYSSRRDFPGGIVMSTIARSEPDGVAFRFSIENGSNQLLDGLDVQMCVMTARLRGFETQKDGDAVLSPPFSAMRSSDGKRWLTTGWEKCARAWANPPCPCIHADPRLESCPPGATRSIRGWVSFYENADIEAELRSLGPKLANDH